MMSFACAVKVFAAPGGTPMAVLLSPEMMSQLKLKETQSGNPKQWHISGQGKQVHLKALNVPAHMAHLDYISFDVHSPISLTDYVARKAFMQPSDRLHINALKLKHHGLKITCTGALSLRKKGQWEGTLHLSSTGSLSYIMKLGEHKLLDPGVSTMLAFAVAGLEQSVPTLKGQKTIQIQLHFREGMIWLGQLPVCAQSLLFQ